MLRFLIQVRNVVHVSIRKIKVFNHEHDTVYYAKCPDESCLRYFVGESSRRVLGRVKDNGTNNSSYIPKRYAAADYQFVSSRDLKILGRNY